MYAPLKALVLIAGVAATAQAWAQLFETPLPPERKFNDRKIIECVRTGVAELRPQFGQLLQRSHELRRNNQSIAPIVVEHRRLEERWCEVEARCAAFSVSENKDFIYGEAFSFCITALPRKGS